MLDLSGRFAGLSDPLVEQAERLYVLDPGDRIVRRADDAASDRNFDHVVSVRGDPLDPPIEPGTIERIIVGDLHSFVFRLRQFDPSANLRTILADLRTLLVEGGELYFGARNRIDLSRLGTGKKSPDWSSIGFFRSLFHGGRADEIHTRHTMWGYRALLTGVGYSNVTFLSAIPDHLEPGSVFSEGAPIAERIVAGWVPLHAPGPVTERALTTAVRVAERVGALEFFSPAYLIRARR